MKTILVTGGTGFIGRTLVPLLAARGYIVRLALRRPSPLFPDAVVVGSIGSDTDWREAMSGVDAVVHLAARVHVMDEHAMDPLAAFCQVNTEGTLALARMAARKGVSRFVFVSSVKAGGERSEGRPLTEDMEPKPETPYGISKLEAERGLMDMEGLHPVILRPPLVYGAGAKGNFRVLMRLVAKGVPLPLGSVSNRRSLVYVGNLADAILHSLEKEDMPAGVYYLADEPALSTAGILEKLAVAMGRKSLVFRFPPRILVCGAWLLRRKDMWEKLCGNLELDSGKFREKAGWKPPFSMEEGFALTAEWFKAFLEGRTE